MFFFFKQKTAYEIVSRDWSSDVCSSDLPRSSARPAFAVHEVGVAEGRSPEAAPAQLLLCMIWVLQRGGAPKQRPPSFCCA